VRIALCHRGHADRYALIRAELRSLWLERLARHGSDAQHMDALLGDDMDLNAQGLIAWLERNERSPERMPTPR
jgi:hypothetical protein